MKLVRFKENYCADINNRISYELVSDEMVWDFDEDSMSWDKCYNLKLLGLIPAIKLEEADGTETEAIEIFIKLSNQ